MFAPFHSTIDRGEYEKYLFLPLYENMENPLMTVHIISHSEMAKGRLRFVFSVV